jgi:hypothetical protein
LILQEFPNKFIWSSKFPKLVTFLTPKDFQLNSTSF